MKKLKRVLAIIGLVVIALLYILTIIFAIADFPGSKDLLMAAITCTVLVPVLIYAMTLLTRLLEGKGADESENKSDQ